MNRLFFAALFLSLMTLLSLSCGNPSPEEKTPNQEGDPPSSVIVLSAAQIEAMDLKVGRITHQPFGQQVQVTGKIDVPPSSQATISPYLGGYVKQIQLLEGQFIRKGQRLLSLENPAFLELQQAYLEAKAQLNYLKADYDRQQTLAAENIASQKQALKAESDYRTTLSRYQGLRQQLTLLQFNLAQIDSGNLSSQLHLYAPISGYITEVRAVPGQYVDASEIAVKMVNTQHMHVELAVFEKDIFRVQKGQRFQFRVPNRPEQAYEGIIHLVGREIEGERRIVYVHGHLEDEVAAQDQLVPGMFVEADLLLGEELRPCLPESALVPNEGQLFVLRVLSSDGGQYQLEPVAVQIGLRKGGWVEILPPLGADSTAMVVLQGGFQLLQGE
jgi:cobalt-zinc-cadmium efflux system membrane fusion protein